MPRPASPAAPCEGDSTCSRWFCPDAPTCRRLAGLRADPRPSCLGSSVVVVPHRLEQRVGELDSSTSRPTPSWSRSAGLPLQAQRSAPGTCDVEASGSPVGPGDFDDPPGRHRRSALGQKGYVVDRERTAPMAAPRVLPPVAGDVHRRASPSTGGRRRSSWPDRPGDRATRRRRRRRHLHHRADVPPLWLSTSDRRRRPRPGRRWPTGQRAARWLVWPGRRHGHPDRAWRGRTPRSGSSVPWCAPS